MKKQSSPKIKNLWLAVGLTMLVVVGLWALWLYPQSTRQLSRDNPGQYENFKNKITDALLIFKKNQPATAANNTDDVQALRAKVFGAATYKKP